MHLRMHEFFHRRFHRMPPCDFVRRKAMIKMGTSALDSLLATAHSSRVWSISNRKSEDKSEKRFFNEYHRRCSTINQPNEQVYSIDNFVTLEKSQYNSLSPIPTSKTETVLRLNIGGTSFWLNHHTIMKSKLHKSFLYRFAKYSEQYKRKYCQDYLPETKEYFFERSAVLFRPIYIFFLTGEKSEPNFGCHTLFEEELEFWGVSGIFVPKCCKTHKMGLKKICDEEQQDKAEQFKNVTYGTIRFKIWNLIEEPDSSTASRFTSGFCLLAILVSNIVLILGSMTTYQVSSLQNITINGIEYTEPHPYLQYIEAGCIAVFTVEYITKIIVASHRFEVFVEAMNMIDLIAILPYYLEMSLYWFGFNIGQMQNVKWALLVLRVLRIMRVIRLLKLGRHSTGLKMFAMTMQRSQAQLGMSLIVLGVAMMFYSTILYYIEKDEIDSKFQSVPAGLWWSIVTMTTVGYGDMYPETIAGKIVASTCIASGVLVIALPITVVVENYVQLRAELLLSLSNETDENNGNQ